MTSTVRGACFLVPATFHLDLQQVVLTVKLVLQCCWQVVDQGCRNS